jgi:hypothetical protein
MRRIAAFLSVALMCAALAAAQKKPMTNADVVKLTAAGMSEDVIIKSINTNEANFDTTTDALIALKKAKLSQKVIDAMMSKGAPGTESSATAGGTPPPTASTAAATNAAEVILRDGMAKRPLTAEKTNIAQTKEKAANLGGLAGNPAVTQAMTSVAQTAAWSAASRSGSYTGGAIANAGIGAIGGIMGRRKPTMTHIWALQGQHSPNVIKVNTPKLELSYGNVVGLNPDDFEPSIVRLTPSQSNYRLVGATEAKQDVYEQPEWSTYSSMMEDKVPATVTKLDRGKYSLTPTAPLPVGEYGVVLRPLNKAMKFNGKDVMNGSGAGMVFSSVWSFSIQP